MELTERVAALETDQRNLFHRLDELKRDVSDIHRLTVSVELIARRTEETADRVASIDRRLETVEKEPAEAAKYLRRTVIACLVSAAAGYAVSALLGILF